MEVRKYYEKEAQLLADHQEKMYFGDAWSKYRHATRLIKVLKIIENINFKNFLEVGCAEGYYLKVTADIAASSKIHQVGLDISKGYLIRAKKNASEVTYVLGEAANLPFKDNCFEFVFCSEVLEHVPDPKKVFCELSRITKKYILLTVAGENLFYYITCKLKLIKPEEPYARVGHGHIHEMKIKEITAKWALEKRLKTLKRNVDCHFPVAFMQRHRMPTFLIPLIQTVDQIISRLPVVKEYGSSQIALLEKSNHSN